MNDLRQTVTIKLVENELLELQRILVDRDADAALEFLTASIVPKLPKKDGRACNPSNFNQYL